MSASANNPEPPPEGGACDQKAALQPIASAYSTDPFQNSVQESKEELAFTADARLLDESAEGLAPALVGGGGTAGVQELSAETPPPPPPPPPSVEGAPALPPPDALAVGGEGIDRPAVQVLSAAPALPDDCGDGRGDEDESLTLEGMLQEAKVQKQKGADIRERVDLEVEAVMATGVTIHPALRAMAEGEGSEGASAAQAPASTQSSPSVHEPLPPTASQPDAPMVEEVLGDQSNAAPLPPPAPAARESLWGRVLSDDQSVAALSLVSLSLSVNPDGMVIAQLSVDQDPAGRDRAFFERMSASEQFNLGQQAFREGGLFFKALYSKVRPPPTCHTRAQHTHTRTHATVAGSF